MTLADVGVVVALVASIINAGFVFGVLYSQVAENTQFRKDMQPTLIEQTKDIASIKTSLEYLVDRDKEAWRKEANR